MKIELKRVEEIKEDMGIEKNGPVQKFFQNTAYKRMDKYVPYREGGLAYNQVDLSNPEYIVYNSPYASYMYNGIVYVMENGKSAYYSPSYGFWSEPGKKKKPSDRTFNYKTSAGHPYAGAHWDNRMWSAEGQELVKDVQNFIDKGGTA